MHARPEEQSGGTAESTLVMNDFSLMGFTKDLGHKPGY